jgi:hypothetical protein
MRIRTTTTMKNTIKDVLATFALLFAAALPSFAQQNTLIMTTLSQAQDATSNIVQLASLTGITAGPNGSPTQSNSQTILYIDGEQENVLVITGQAVTVSRGQAGTRANAHSKGNMVLAGRPVWFYRFNPSGACVAANVYATPWVNVLTGQQWLCSSVTLSWEPGWNNDWPAGVTAAVASAAGQITPSGPLFHITGGLAITGFLTPIGCNATAVGQCGPFTVIPDGTFTWTTANNIALLGTAVVNKTITFTWDATNSKWVPSSVN